MNLHIGTAGWSYKDWVPGFYPKSQSKNFDWLSYYARYFNTAEVNATYYAYLDPKIFESWVKKLQHRDDFLFTVKLHQDFTHKRQYTAENIKAVEATFKILRHAERLGGVLIQFPYSFDYNEAAMEYIAQLKEIFSADNIFLEIRHASWNNDTAYEFFRRADISLCVIDQPQIGRSVPFSTIITNDKAYFRFHGRNTEEWKKSIINYGKEQNSEQASARYKYLYSPGELVEIEQKLKQVYDKVKELYIIMNNHPSSYGVVNAFELLYMLKGSGKISIPENTIKTYPRLLAIAEGDLFGGN